MTISSRTSQGAATTVSRFAVADMECAGCVAKVEEAIARVDGISTVTTSLVARRVAVQHHKSVTRQTIGAAISAAGFTPGETETTSSYWTSSSWWRSRDRLCTLVSGIFFAAGLAAAAYEPANPARFIWEGIAGWSAWLLLLAAVAGGLNFFGKGLLALQRLSLDMNFLMTVAILGAVIIGEYAEAAAIAFLFSTAERLEEFAVDRARHSLKALMDLAPDTATVRRDGRELEVAAADVVAGDLILVRPGSRIPVDAKVVEGGSHVDQAAITGESMPVYKQFGTKLFAGCINGEGYLEALAERKASDSTLNRIIHMVEQAEEHRAPSEHFVRRFARIYTPVITAIAGFVVLVPPLLFGADFLDWFVRGLTLLVIACPCALVISTPVAVISAITSAARHGVLLKGGNHLEVLGQVRAIAFDKTGTLTEGRLQVTDVLSFDGQLPARILELAAALEQRAHHPVGQAIVDHAARQSDGTGIPTVVDFVTLPGLGVRGRIAGDVYTVGRSDLFAAADRELVALHESRGRTTVLVGRGKEPIGLIALADTVRPGAREAIASLRQQGFSHIMMLTGDHEATAGAIAGQLGIDDWRSGLLPNEKVSAVVELRHRHGAVAMVGDGVNDAPALAAADVGIAMGAAGSDAALETADVALMADDVGKLPYLFRLSRRSRRVIRQNVSLSIVVKLALVAGVVPGAVSLIVAVLLGDVGTSLLVTGNATRLAAAGRD